MSTVRITPTEMTVVGRRRPLTTHLREIWAYRELLAGLTRKELKVRYKNSALGFVWSMVQPVWLLAVYSVAFSILGSAFKSFAIWLLCGLIVWNFISTCFTTAVESITANAHLVTKVRFPRAILPLATVGAAAIHLALQLGAFAIVLAVTRHPVAWSYMWLLVPAIVAALVFCAALGLILAAMNVKARDTKHLLDLAVLGWFWLTPILYSYRLAANFFSSHGLPDSLGLLNPATSIIITFQRAIYGAFQVGTGTTANPDEVLALLPSSGPVWYLRNLAVVFGLSLLLFAWALRIFDRAEANFAEDL